LRPRHTVFPLRIASVLLINNQHAPRLRISPIHLHLTFIPTSHLYTYIYCLDRLPTTLPLLPRSTASSAYLPRCLYCLDRLPTPLPLLPQAPTYPAASTASIDCLPRCLYCLDRLPQAPTYPAASTASSAFLLLPNSSLERILPTAKFEPQAHTHHTANTAKFDFARREIIQLCGINIIPLRSRIH
jgi:hypothetical protein